MTTRDVFWEVQGPDSFVCPFRSADPFAKKDWYDIKAPSMFSSRNVGKTLVTRTQGTKVHIAAARRPSQRLSPAAGLPPQAPGR